ncbi:hypothetical protein DSECCO2_425110 [anaerobic digester metagenome]
MSECWVSYPELRDLVGADEATALCTNHGGVPVYVPRNPESSSKLGRLVGAAALRVLCQEFGGSWISVPNARKPEARKGEVLRLLEAGVSHSQIALHLGVTERYVRAVGGQRPTVRQLSLPL